MREIHDLQIEKPKTCHIYTLKIRSNKKIKGSLQPKFFLPGPSWPFLPIQFKIDHFFVILWLV